MNISALHSSSMVADTHPLDPLTSEELTRTAAILRDHFSWGDELRVETIDIDEPVKEVARTYQPGDPLQRTARFKIYRHGVTGVWEGKVDLGAGKKGEQDRAKAGKVIDPGRQGEIDDIARHRPDDDFQKGD